MLYQITSTYFYAGIETDRGIVTKKEKVRELIKGYLYPP